MLLAYIEELEDMGTGDRKEKCLLLSAFLLPGVTSPKWRVELLPRRPPQRDQAANYVLLRG